jgi:uncharacterized protein
MVTDPAAAMRFYGTVFGWSFEPAAPGLDYRYAYQDGHLVAGLNPVSGDYLAPDWNVYLATEDAAATAFRAVSLGGTVLIGPSTVDPFGSFLIARDPAGAQVAFWQPGSRAGLELADAPGSPTWYELWVRDPAAADRFYTGMYGYQRTGQGPYRTYGLDGTACAGRFVLGGADIPTEVAARWVLYLAVADCDAAFATAVTAGAKPVRAPDTSPHGRWAILRDPWGALFALLTRQDQDK